MILKIPPVRKLGEGDGNFFQVPAKFSVLSIKEGQGTPASNRLCILMASSISLRHEFRIYDYSNSLLGVMKKKIVKLIGQEYWLEQNGVELMRVYGNFTAHEYQMSVNGQIVAQVHKKWVAIRDSFEVSIMGNIDPRLVIGSIIIVEHVEVTRRDNNSGSFGF